MAAAPPDTPIRLTPAVEQTVMDAALISSAMQLPPLDALLVALELGEHPWATEDGFTPMGKELAHKMELPEAGKGEDPSLRARFARFKRESSPPPGWDAQSELGPVLQPAARMGGGSVTPPALVSHAIRLQQGDEAAQPVLERPVTITSKRQRVHIHHVLSLEDARREAGEGARLVVALPAGQSAEPPVEGVTGTTPPALRPLRGGFQLWTHPGGFEVFEGPSTLDPSTPTYAMELEAALAQVAAAQPQPPTFWWPLHPELPADGVPVFMPMLDAFARAGRLLLSYTEPGGPRLSNWDYDAPADTLQAALAHLLERNASPDPVAAHSDVVGGEDALDQARVAQALAWTVCMREVKPPLCIGVLGAWGTGKSFLMRMLVDELSAEPRHPHASEDLRPKLLDERIEIVKFNAWTYATADLWSALLYEILSQLANVPRSRTKTEEARWQRRRSLATAEYEIAALESQREALQREVKLAALERDEQIREQRHLRDAARRRLDDTRRQQWSWSGFVESYLAGFRGQGEHAAPGWLWGGLLALSGAAVLAGLDEGAAQWLQRVEAQLAHMLAAVGGLIAHAFGIIKAVAGRANEAIDDVQREVKSAEAELEKLLGVDPDPASGSAGAGDDDDEAQDPATKLLACEAQLAEETAKALDLRKELEHLEGDEREDFDAFLRRRLAEADYEEALGSLHRIQLDLELIAKRATERAGGAPERIILLIDDLDRCPPDKVVRVLEAIQLLLASNAGFEEQDRKNPFVVVLGADTRILTRALEAQYEGVLERDRRPSGLDYLEKIIQVPYWIPAIDEASYESYVSRLTGVPFPADEGMGVGVAPQVAGAGAELGDGQSADAVRVKLEPQELIDESDMRLFRVFRALTAPNARAVKRLVNQYRLCKVIAQNQPRDVFDPVATMFLLCMADGYRAPTRLLKRMLEHSDGSSGEDVQQYFSRIQTGLTSTALRTDVAHLLTTLATLGAEHKPTMAQLAQASPRVLPFCFIGDLGRVSTQSVSFEDFDAATRPPA